MTYTARVVAADGDDATLELIEENPSGAVGFEGTAFVRKTSVDVTDEAQLSTVGANK